MYERILVALDGSEIAETILPHVEALAARFGSTITLLRATPDLATTQGALVRPMPFDMPAVQPVPDAVDIDNLMELERQEADDYLSSIAERLAGQGLTVEREEHEGSPAGVILARARELHASLIAMTTHGRSGLARLVMGSVADEVLRNAPCPVLIVRVAGPEGRESHKSTNRKEEV